MSNDKQQKQEKRGLLGSLDKTAMRSAWTAVGALILVFLVCYAVVIFSLSPPRKTVSVGDTLAQDMIALRDMPNEAQTERLREEAAAKVEKIYLTDEEILTSLMEGAGDFFDSLERLRADAELMRMQKAAAAEAGSELRELSTGTLTAAQWQAVLQAEDLAVLRSSALDGLSDANIYEVLAVPEVSMRTWLREASVRLNTILRGGVKEGETDIYRTQYIRELEPLTVIGIKPVCSLIAREFINPTMFYNETATMAAIEQARSLVPEQVTRKGEALAPAGALVTEEMYEMFQEAGVLASFSTQLLTAILLAVFVAILMLVLSGLMAVYLSKIIKNPTRCLLTAILCVISVLFAYLLLKLNEYFIPSYLAVLLITLLVSGKVASVAAIFLSVIFGLIAAGPAQDYTLFAQVFCMALAGGLVGVLFVRKAVKRSTVFGGGALSSLVMILVYCAFGVLTGTPAMDMFWNCVRLLGVGLASAVVGLGLLPVWEVLFDIATPQRLGELSNANHPLLQRLMFEAPGTYHHSMMVATLAEAAATAIGANALLARVGSFYHDIGKLKRPYYFKENQKSGDNPHDSLPPEKSAAVLFAHVKDGIAMAQKNKLPADVIRIIAEHHGNTFAAVFYYKAIQASGDKDIPMSQFRYPGPRPGSKESAIVMLADSAEAAVRSLDNPSREDVQEMVAKVIKGKIEDGQMNNSPLTFAEVELITRAMLSAFQGILHERIEYPDLEESQRIPKIKPAQNPPAREEKSVQAGAGQELRAKPPVEGEKAEQGAGGKEAVEHHG